MYTSSNQRTFGPHTAIVQTLKRYKEVPVDFLAETLGSTPEETREHLLNLEEEGVVEQRGDRVRLSRHGGKAAAAVG